MKNKWILAGAGSLLLILGTPPAGLAGETDSPVVVAADQDTIVTDGAADEEMEETEAVSEAEALPFDSEWDEEVFSGTQQGGDKEGYIEDPFAGEAPVYAGDYDFSGEGFSLDLDYILSYGQQCSDMIFFGDSRVVGMSYDAGGYHYVGKVSAGYSWMTGDGMAQLIEMMNAWPQADVVFCFGVNDLGNAGSYISYYQSFLAKYPNKRVWFLSVNPVSEGTAARAGYTVRNSGIASFNASLQSAFPDRYIDSYSYLMTYGVGTGDGVHYAGSTYAAIQDYTWRSIQEKLDQENNG